MTDEQNEQAATADAPTRIVYHPAPFPGPDGTMRTPAPIDLGSDLARAAAWMRRRLSLYDGPPITDFSSESIDIAAPAPMSETELAAARSQAEAAVEAYDAEQADRALDELAEDLPSDEMYDDPLAGLDDELPAGADDEQHD